MIRIYKSTDAGAPVLTGQVGTLVALLDACLVNGYGAKAAAGWTKPYAAANKGAYKQDVAVSNNAAGMHLYVDDTGPGAGGAREARWCGFETMTAITPTGTGQFPTAAQSSIGIGTLVCRKSITADATARVWTLIANGATVYLFIETGDITSPIVAYPMIFGDFKSFKAGDQYAVTAIGRMRENDSNPLYDPFQIVPGNSAYNLGNVIFGHFIARSWTGVGGSIKCGKTYDISRVGYNSGAAGWGGDAAIQVNGNTTIAMGRNWNANGAPAPMPIDGSILLSQIYLNHGYSLRGYLSGLWAPLHDLPGGHSDTITIAAGPLNGKSLTPQNIPGYIQNAAERAQVFAEYSDTWS